MIKKKLSRQIYTNFLAIEKEYNLDFKYNNHRILIRTINLNSNWKNISLRLKEIISMEEY